MHPYSSSVFFRTLFSKAELEGQAQPEAVVQARGPAAEPERHAAVFSSGVPAAATGQAVRARRWSLGIRLAIGVSIAVIPVTTPLKDVTRHVIQAQLVRSLGGHGMGFAARITAIPGHFINVITAGIFAALAQIASTGSELPFGLGGAFKNTK